MREKADAIKRANMKVFVRRGGPNYQVLPGITGNLTISRRTWKPMPAALGFTGVQM